MNEIRFHTQSLIRQSIRLAMTEETRLEGFAMFASVYGVFEALKAKKLLNWLWSIEDSGHTMKELHDKYGGNHERSKRNN